MGDSPSYIRMSFAVRFLTGSPLLVGFHPEIGGPGPTNPMACTRCDSWGCDTAHTRSFGRPESSNSPPPRNLIARGDACNAAASAPQRLPGRRPSRPSVFPWRTSRGIPPFPHQLDRLESDAHTPIVLRSFTLVQAVQPEALRIRPSHHRLASGGRRDAQRIFLREGYVLEKLSIIIHSSPGPPSSKAPQGALLDGQGVSRKDHSV